MVPLLAIRTWESRSALLAHLEACEARTVVLGREAEAPRAYYSLSVASNHARGEIGVISSGLGPEIAAVALSEGRQILVGHDTWLSWIDVGALAIVSSLRLGGAFFAFLSVDRDDEIVALHELGALRVDANAVVKWSVDSDVVKHSTTDAKGNVILTVMDGPRLVVSLESGAVSS